MDTAWLRVGLFVLVVAGSGAACDGQASIADVNRAADEVDSALGAVLAQGAPEDSREPRDWERFFDEGEARVTRLEIAFDRWSALLDDAQPPPPDSLFDYRDALGDYVAALREQATLGRDCMSGHIAPSRTAARCFESLVARHGPEWQRIADRATQARSRAG